MRPEDEAVLFGLARLDRGADERTLEVLEHETTFVADVAGRPAGYVALFAEEGRMRIDQLFVSPEHEAEGVGRQLLEYAEGFAISEGAEALEVVVAEDDARAVAFYRSRGFAAAGQDVFELVLPRPG
jgi:ribosomal protein S18 acetylase RimI-like enzyme